VKAEIRVRDSSGLNYPLGRWDWYSPGRPHYNLWILQQGSGVLYVNGRDHHLKPGFALLLHPEDRVEGTKPEEVSFCNIALHFDHSATSAKRRQWDRFRQSPTQLKHLNLIFELSKYLTQLLPEKSLKAQEERDQLGAQIVRIFVRDWEQGPEDPADARLRLLAEIARNHPERPWTVPGMAKEAGLSTSQFSRRFNRLFGVPPNGFLIDSRVAKARAMLRESTLTVSEISDALGYSDMAFFSKQFKSQTGSTPLAYRRA